MNRLRVDQLTLHPEASRVPEVPADEYTGFLADVKARGVKVPLEVIPGTTVVVDGRTRLRAAKDAGFDSVPVVDADIGVDSPLVYMLRAALTRRHLTSGQRAALATDIEEELAKEAKERQRQNARATASEKVVNKWASNKEQFPYSRPTSRPVAQPQSRDQAAATAGTNPRYVSDAKAVKAASPELFEKVKAGAVTLPQARLEVRRQQKRDDLKAKADAAPESDSASWEIVCGEVGIGDDCPLCRVDRGSVRLVFADPPYNIGFDYGEGHDDLQPAAQYLQWCERWISRCADTLAPDGSMWVLINDEYAAEYKLLLDRMGLTLRNWLIWYESFGVNCSDKFNRTKRHLFYYVRDPANFVFHFDAVSRPSDRQTKYNDARANPGGKVLDDVWFDIPRLTGTAAERMPDFPTQLPLALLRRVISCATDPGDRVLDPFNGSGTTGAAAIQLGRSYLGFERSTVFANFARLRLKGVSREAD